MREERLRQPVVGAARTTGVLTLWLALIPAAGCGGGSAADPAPYPVPGCESIDPSACDVRTTPCQMRLFSMAACLRSEQPGSLPPLTVVSEADFAAMLAADPSLTTPRPHLATWDWALSSLKIIQPGALAPQAMIAQKTQQLWGLYREDTKDILIIDHGSDFNEQSASTVVVHEMVHALQDRDVVLSQLWSTFAKSGDDSVMAVKSIVEGEARMQETRYQASVLGLDPANVDLMRRFENAVTRDETNLFMQTSLLTASAMLFPYEWGARYVYFRWMAQGSSGVQALFQSPPVTTRVVMASVDQTLDPEPAPAPPDLPAPPADWVGADSDTMGAWGLFLALEESAPGLTASEIQSLAIQWQADRLGIYEQPGGATAFVWRINLADDATAARVLQLLQSGLSTISLRQQGTWVVAASESDQQIGDWAFGP